MGSYLLLGVVLVFVLALVSSFLRHRTLDRVLRKLRGFYVTVEIDSERVWGRFRLFSNAMELLFSQPYVNHRGTSLSSFIVFKEQMPAIQGIFRFHDELTPHSQQLRLEEIERVRNPDLQRRMKRSVRNFTAAFRDAISESIGLMSSKVKQYSGLALLKDVEGKKLQKVGNDILDMASNTAYDPVLEHYIFHRVVFEVDIDEGGKTEYSGILEEYSGDWVSLLDCYLDTENEISLMDAAHLLVQRSMDFNINLSREGEDVDLALRVVNRDEQDIQLLHIKGPESFDYKIGQTLRPGEAADLKICKLPAASLSNVNLEDLPVSLDLVAPERQKGRDAADGQEQMPAFPLLPELRLTFQTCRGVDIYIPRSRGVLRHAGEYQE